MSRIAAVLGVSDQTVLRRYRRLERLLGLRVTVQLDSAALGYEDWFVRFECTPDDALPVATSLARQRRTAWVMITSGGTEIIGAVLAMNPGERHALLLNQLASSDRVRASAHCILHRYQGGPRSHPIRSALSPDQQRSLEPSAPPDGAGVGLERGDAELVDALHRDGRTTLASLAAETGWPESRVRRRIDQLAAAGILYFEVDVDGRALGKAAPAMLWMRVDPARLEETGEAISLMDEIHFAGATSGPSNLLVSVTCSDFESLYQLITKRIGAMPGIQGLEVSPVIRTLKRHGPLMAPVRKSASGQA